MSRKWSNAEQGMSALDLDPVNPLPVQPTEGYKLTYWPAQLCARFTIAFSVRKSAAVKRLKLQTSPESEDLPMSRVKFNVNTEYAYLQNFKILQSIWVNLAEQLSVSNQVQAVS